MSQPPKLVRIPSLKSVEEFRGHLAALGLNLPCDDRILVGEASPLAQAAGGPLINGKRPGNRFAIQPMEGWDATAEGKPSPDTMRRWQRFGESGAKLICGGEAMAVTAEGRSNPRQMQIHGGNAGELRRLREALEESHRAKHGRTDDLVVGFQLTHSGRFCRPNSQALKEPRVAFRHPLLDERFGVTDDRQVVKDEELPELVEAYARAAQTAREAGADFVDIKHCHGYLLHEFLGAHTRPGRYGGSFENRTRLLREIVGAIRASGNPIDLAVRLSAFDFVPFRPDPALSLPGKPGPGVPEDFSRLLPYDFAFGCNALRPIEPDLREPLRLLDLCLELGIRILNVSAGSPYYNPHIQRPAAYPPSDGYQPPNDPLVDVVRQIETTRKLKSRLRLTPGAADKLLIVGSAYSYLQEYLPHVAQAVLRKGWTDAVGIGRSVLSYPAMLADAIQNGCLAGKLICRTFSDCTTAPRNGLVSGCYPLDRHYGAKPEFQALRELKRKSAS